MEIDRKLKALGRMYAIYDEFIRTGEAACRMHCSRCCTTHVTLTTLEAYHITQTLRADEVQTLFGRVRTASGSRRFRPRFTTNELADLCAADAEPPPEEEHTADKCPLLAEALCSIYAVRPFNCRCFTSRVNCSETGVADMDDGFLAVNTLFLQTIEHLDADGCSGNLMDVLEVLAAEENRQAYAGGMLACAGSGLIANRPLRVLMIPPEHCEKIDPIMRRLREIRV